MIPRIDVIDLAIANELANASINCTEANGLLPRTTITVALGVVLHT